MIHEIKSQNLALGVNTFGGRIAYLRWQGREDILQALPRPDASACSPDECGGFALLPICNRVRGNSYVFKGRKVTLPLCSPDGSEYNHGPGWCSSWSLSGQEERRVCLCFDYERPEDLYAYRAELSFTLEDGKEAVDGAEGGCSAMRIKLKLINRSRAELLFGLGFHPYFAVEPETVLCFKASGFYPEGEHNLSAPWQAEIPAEHDYSSFKRLADTYCNICYSGVGSLRLRRASGLEVSMHSPFTYLMMYHLKDGRFAALEPQSHPVDAVHQPGFPGLTALPSGSGELAFEAVIAVKGA